MKRHILILLAVLSGGTLFPQNSGAEWGPGGCAPVGANEEYVWNELECDLGRVYLFRGQVQVGGYDIAEGYYRAYDVGTGVWGEPQMEPPVELPARVKEKRMQSTGVDASRISRTERYSINGMPVTKELAQQILGDEKRIPNDANSLRLTVIGPDAERRRVRDDLEKSPLLSAHQGKLAVQDYPPDHWAVAQAGFFTGGKPTIYLQTPDGKVLHRQDDYDDGAEGLAAALRRANPNYDFKKDPDLRKLPFRPPVDLSIVPLPAWFLAAGVLYLLSRRK